MTRVVLKLLAFLLVIPPAYGKIDVVVSIKPLQLLASAVLGDGGEVAVLVPPTGSPHHYTMTPSDRLALESADLLVYVGEPLETELHGIMRGLASDRPVLELLQLPGLTRRQLPGSASLDPHIWLDSRNGLLIAAALRDRFMALDPDQASHWAANYAALEQELLTAESAWEDRLSQLPATPYAVYHDAIGYFEARYDLDHAVVLVDDPELQPGIRHLIRVREDIARLRPACLFTDVTSRQNTIETLFASQQVRQQRLDLLGDQLEADEGYPQLLGNLADDMIGCLSGASDR